MLRILGKNSSINVRKVLWTCAEIGLEYELEAWGSGLRDTHHPTFVALNPNALDHQLAQSNAFVVGQNFTLADVALGLSAHRWFSTPMQRPTLPHVDAYYERLSERSGFMLHGRNGTP